MDHSGQFTSQVYGYIRDVDYGSAVDVLETQLQRFPRSRAALSLLGYCYYHIQNFELASEAYAKLVRLYPYITEYRIYYSQALLKIGDVEEARQTEFRHLNDYYDYHDDVQSHNHRQQEQPQRTQRELMLQVSIKFEEGDLIACKGILSRCVEEDPETMLARATLFAKEGRYDDALEVYLETFNTHGFEAEVAYNIAFCNYMIGEYEEAMDMVQEIIERGDEEFDRSNKKDLLLDDKMGDHVSNTIQLQQSFLVEAYNLKAAIEFKNSEEMKARDTLKFMPQRKEQELDPVTLHNQGLVNFELDLNGCFERLKFLLANPPFPPEAFGNLLLLYCKLGYYDLAADILAENSHLTYDYLSEELYEFLDTSIMSKASPDEALLKFDELMKKYVLQLRKLSNDIDSNEDESTVKEIKSTYDETIKSFIPILMAQASMFWEREEYNTIEQLFRKSADICVDIDVWRLNVAHTFFVQQKFKDAIKYYETFVRENSSESMLNIAPIVLANLCVSYIMTDQNEVAEEIMKQVGSEENEDKKTTKDDQDNNDNVQKHHSCIINLVIGTLYCEKGNFEFGISRICRSLEPMEKKLGADTWFYTKRCLLALVDYVAKQRLILKRESFHEIVAFLRQVHKHGNEIKADFGHDDMQFDSSPKVSSTMTISAEVLQLKKMFCKLMK